MKHGALGWAEVRGAAGQTESVVVLVCRLREDVSAHGPPQCFQPLSQCEQQLPVRVTIAHHCVNLLQAMQSSGLVTLLIASVTCEIDTIVTLVWLGTKNKAQSS